METEVNLEVDDKRYGKSSLKTEKSHAGECKICVCVYFGKRGSSEVGQIYKEKSKLRRKKPVCFKRLFYTSSVKNQGRTAFLYTHTLSFLFQRKHVYTTGHFTEELNDSGESQSSPILLCFVDCRKQQEPAAATGCRIRQNASCLP